MFLFYIISIGCSYEFYIGLKSKKHNPDILTGLLSGSLTYFLIALFALRIIDSHFLLSGLLILPMICIIELFRNKPDPFINIALAMAGIVYISVPLALVLFLYYPTPDTVEATPTLLLSFFTLIWVNDSMAYIIGSLMGKHRLFERISPKKSWEGSFGGLVFSILVSFFLYKWLGIYSYQTWMIISIIIVILGTLGDLTESMFKRSLEIKDSGTFFPGHGGFLDRFDAVLISIPFVLVFIYIFN